MGMSRCYSFMKCLLILCCIIFMCMGWAACGLAGWALWEGQGRAARAGLGAAAAWGLALGVGAALALCGAARRATAPLLAGLALLTVTAAAEGAAAWWGADHLPQLRAALLDRLRDTVQYDYGIAHTHTQLIDAIQQGLECCGVDGVRDWQRSAWQRVQPDAASAADLALDLSVSAEPSYYWVPPSCCLRSDESECAVWRRVPSASGGGAGLHSAGCGALAWSALSLAARPPLALAAALLALHAVALVLALSLALHHRPPARYKA